MRMHSNPDSNNRYKFEAFHQILCPIWCAQEKKERERERRRKRPTRDRAKTMNESKSDSSEMRSHADKNASCIHHFRSYSPNSAISIEQNSFHSLAHHPRIFICQYLESDFGAIYCYKYCELLRSRKKRRSKNQFDCIECQRSNLSMRTIEFNKINDQNSQFTMLHVVCLF